MKWTCNERKGAFPDVICASELRIMKEGIQTQQYAIFLAPVLNKGCTKHHLMCAIKFAKRGVKLDQNTVAMSWYKLPTSE